MERQAIYVTHPGARVHRADGSVAVSVDRAVAGRWPPEEVDRVLLFGNAQITTQVLALLFKHGIHVGFFSSSGRYRGQLVSPECGNVFLRLAQHARYAEPLFRLAFARELVATKIRAGRSLVRRYSRNHPDSRDRMDETADHLSRALVEVDAAESAQALLGIEGAAAAHYFRAFDRMVRPPFSFQRRSKHPAHNAVNALLNLGYTMLTNEVASRLEAVGFDPRIGYYHGVRYGRSSLALDLVEAHRVDVIDRLTLGIMNRRILAPEDFEEKGDELGTRLALPALRRYLALYEGAMREGEPAPRTRIQEQVNALRRAVMSGRLEWSATVSSAQGQLRTE